MAFRKKNIEPATPEEVAKLGFKDEVKAAKDKRADVYQHFHSQENAKQVADSKKRKKIYGAILASLLAILLIMYIISMLLTQWGDLVISIGDVYDGKSIMLSDGAKFDSAVTTLNGGTVKDVTNITKSWLPEDLDSSKDGAHNGENYLAYTFYLRNTGDKDLEYQQVMSITGVSKSADEAIRFMVYRNGKPSVYAKGQYRNRKEAETDATKWVDDTTVLNNNKVSLKAGDTDKFTVVAWVEGNDRECVDAIRGGHVRAKMIFNIIPDETTAPQN